MQTDVERLDSESPVAAQARRPRTLAVVTFFPLPQNHGDALRRLMVLESLAAVTDLTAVCVARPETTITDVRRLRELLPRATVHVLPLWQDDLGRRSAQFRRLVRGLRTSTPAWIYRQHSEDLDHMVAELTSAQQFDLCVLVGEPAGACAGHVRSGRIVLDKSNVVTASELDAVRTLTSVTGRLRALTAIPLTYAYERRVLSHVHHVVVTSDEETQRMRRHFGTRVGTTVIPSALAPQRRGTGIDTTSRTLLWMSTFSYLPNWDGLLHLLRGAGAALEAEGYTLRVVGAGAAPDQAAALDALPYVDHRGFVEDLSAACEGVAAAVVPVWAGAGVKLKSLTLMALGLPVIATPVALEGIPHEAAARVVRTPPDFVEALRSLSPADLAAAAVRGRAVVEEQFTPAAFQRQVRSLVAAMLPETGPPNGRS